MAEFRKTPSGGLEVLQGIHGPSGHPSWVPVPSGAADEIERLTTAIRQHREHINNQAKHGPTEQADAALWSVLDA